MASLLNSLDRIPGIARLRRHEAVHHLVLAARSLVAPSQDDRQPKVQPVDILIRAWEAPEFRESIGTALNLTLLEPDGLFLLLQMACAATAVPGDFVEFGTYRGGTAWMLANMLAKEAPDRRLALFDTFSGMPETDPERDLHRKGDFADVELAKVQALLKDFPMASIHQGLFSERFADIADRTLAFAHIDCDIYQSVRECCEFVYPRMSPGGFIVFDDYGITSCPGAKLAVDEFFANRPERPIRLTSPQALVVVQAHRDTQPGGGSRSPSRNTV